MVGDQKRHTYMICYRLLKKLDYPKVSTRRLVVLPLRAKLKYTFLSKTYWRKIHFLKILFDFFLSIGQRWRRKQHRDDDDAEKMQKIVRKLSRKIRKQFKTTWKSLEHFPKIVSFGMGALLQIVLEFSDLYRIWYFNFVRECTLFDSLTTLILGTLPCRSRLLNPLVWVHPLLGNS